MRLIHINNNKRWMNEESKTKHSIFCQEVYINYHSFWNNSIHSNRGLQLFVMKLLRVSDKTRAICKFFSWQWIWSTCSSYITALWRLQTNKLLCRTLRCSDLSGYLILSLRRNRCICINISHSFFNSSSFVIAEIVSDPAYSTQDNGEWMEITLSK